MRSCRFFTWTRSWFARCMARWLYIHWFVNDVSNCGMWWWWNVHALWAHHDILEGMPTWDAVLSSWTSGHTFKSRSVMPYTMLGRMSNNNFWLVRSWSCHLRWHHLMSTRISLVVVHDSHVESAFVSVTCGYVNAMATRLRRSCVGINLDNHWSANKKGREKKHVGFQNLWGCDILCVLV